MKRLIPCFLILLSWTVRAQTFEGTIRWTMKMEITDPAMKAKMDEGLKKMQDPATQAKMKEMQAKMNDPQMKALFDANPQMKAQMENALKMMQGGDMSSLMPKGFVIELKNDNALTKMEGGPMAMEVLYLKDKETSYHLDRKNKTYSVLGGASQESKDQGTAPKVTKTSETTTILGYNCTKYLVEMTEGKHVTNEVIWTTTDIKDIDLKSMGKQKMGRGRSLIYAGMDGVPLRVEAVTPEGTMTMEVTEIKRGSLPASDFTLPADFRETKGMFGGM